MSGRKMQGERKQITVSLDKVDVELVQSFCDRTGQNFSGLIDTYIQSMARTLRAVGLDKKKDVTRADLLRVALKGVCESP